MIHTRPASWIWFDERLATIARWIGMALILVSFTSRLAWAQPDPTKTLSNTENPLLDLGVSQLEYAGDINTAQPVKVTGIVAGVASHEGLALNDQINAVNGRTWFNKSQAVGLLARANAEGRFKLSIVGKSAITLISQKEQDRVLQHLGLGLTNSSEEIALSASKGLALRAGLRSGDKVLLLDGDVFRPLPIFQHQLAKNFLDNGRITLRIESNTGERVNVTLPPTAAQLDDSPLLVRGVPSAETGRHVEFPKYLGPAGEVRPANADRRALRANEVVTARVELYYFRDAHRVAQILNRNVKSFNGPAVTQLERAAEAARSDYEETRMNRRQAEADARAAAVELKQLEEDLVRKVGALRAELDAHPDQATSDKAATLRSAIETQLTLVQSKRVETLRKQTLAERAEDRETVAAKDQFRREVSAAKADPDTYVPGNTESIDPVSQVSISVIGEGVLHLRGPRAGITKLRYMIDQIDHPIGQVKVGVLTVQLNGENGPRMENTLRRVEGNISRARFLTYVTNQLFVRALSETAHRVAIEADVQPAVSIPLSECQPARGTPEQQHRWQKYLQAFFGADFLAELRDVDPKNSLENPLHKLLALNSMDTTTLAEAMFVVGLAKNSIRQEVLARFHQYLACDLPEKEVQWILTNKLYCHKDPRWWGDAKWGRASTYENAMLRYRFSAIESFFERHYESGDALTPFQREIVKLTQGVTLAHALHQQRQALLSKLSLLEEQRQYDSNGRTGLSEMDVFFLRQELDSLEERHLNAVESLRGRKAAIDKLIKEVMIALEDDVYAQYYNPALERIRNASKEWDVELAAIERTTLLTNNRAFGKVTPQATFEFDLPRRDIVVAEALKAAHALHKDLGPLLADPEFATLTKMMSNSPLNGDSPGSVKNVLPGLPSDTDQRELLFGDSTSRKHFGTELEKLVPEPAIYKFETGTGFEVRPVVQPDGQSVTFDFNYMYTTDLLEPVRANEKHLGRIKRHFINTEVQLGNLEWREISRYEVALKASRNARGVPLLEDIPVVGVLARPLPQAQKSLQKNIIIGQASIYPTVEDLLGLKATSLIRVDSNRILCDAEAEGRQYLNRLRYSHHRANERLNELFRSHECFPLPLCPDPFEYPNEGSAFPQDDRHLAPPSGPSKCPPRMTPTPFEDSESQSPKKAPLPTPPEPTTRRSENFIRPASFERESESSLPASSTVVAPGSSLNSPLGKATGTGPNAAAPRRTRKTP